MTASFSFASCPKAGWRRTLPGALTECEAATKRRPANPSRAGSAGPRISGVANYRESVLPGIVVRQRGEWTVPEDTTRRVVGGIRIAFRERAGDLEFAGGDPDAMAVAQRLVGEHQQVETVFKRVLRRLYRSSGRPARELVEATLMEARGEWLDQISELTVVILTLGTDQGRLLPALRFHRVPPKLLSSRRRRAAG